MVIWPPSGVLDLYYEYMGTINDIFSVDAVFGDWSVTDFIFWSDYFSVCVDFHTKSCWIIIASSAPLVSCRWSHDLLISTVLRKV